MDQQLTQHYTYYPNGELETATDARGYTTSYGYNTHGDLTDVTTPEGRHTHYDYDTEGRRISEVDPRAYDTTPPDVSDYKTAITYNDRDQVKTVTDPLNHTTTYAYDDQTGNLLSFQDANLHTTSYGYYNDGLLHTVTQPGTPAAVTTYTYDKDHNVASVVDADGRTTAYSYDLANELTTEQTPLGSYAYTYDNDGRVISSKKPGETNVTSYQLDARGDVLTTTYPNFAHTNYTYDIHGNRTSMANYGSGGFGGLISSSTYTYNDYDQLTAVATSVANPTTYTYNDTYTYDPDGNLASSTGPEGARSYSYDHDDLLTTVNKGTDDLADYTYTSAGAPKTITYGDGSHQTLTYDNSGALTHHTDLTASGAILVDDTYGLDGVGNPTSITHHETAGDTTDSYTYNARDQLTEVCFNNTSPSCSGATDYVDWNYDAASNRTQETRPSGTTTYAYDTNTGELSSTTGPGGTTSYTYNGAGELTGDGTTSYTYNPDTTVASQTATSSGVATAYTYDGDGRRITTQVGATGAANSITRDDWDPQTYQLSAELDGNNTLLRDLSYGLGPIAFSTTTAPGSNSYVHTDIQGSITAVTGPDGASDATTTYEPYGIVKSHQTLNPNAPTSPLGWEGQYTDPDGQSNLRARLYNPTTGTFSVPDPAQATSTSATYTYGDGNPMTESDPTGLGTSLGIGSLLNPMHNIGDTISAASNAWSVCTGHKGGCGAAILGAALSGTVAAAKILVDAALIYGTTVLTDGIGDAVLAEGLGDAAGGDLAGELGGELAGQLEGEATTATEGGDEGLWAYRGVGRDHPGYDDALQGNANPRDANGTATAEQHNLGNTSESPYTSWTRNPDIARRFAGDDGVVLRVARGAGSPYKFEWSPDVYFEEEVLIRGPVSGAEVLP